MTQVLITTESNDNTLLDMVKSSFDTLMSDIKSRLIDSNAKVIVEIIGDTFVQTAIFERMENNKWNICIQPVYRTEELDSDN